MTVSGKLQHIFDADERQSLLASPGVISDSWISAGIFRRFAAITTGTVTNDKPVIMVIGGSLGAASVNDNVRKILPELLKDFQVVHLCGKGKTDESLKGTTGYVQYEYIQDELPDLFAMADVVISRAGANAICEIRELHKPNLLIPLSAKASRGDQILNARSFERQGFSMVLEEEEITETKLLDTIHQLYTDRQKYTEAMAGNGRVDSISKITELIEECARS